MKSFLILVCFLFSGGLWAQKFIGLDKSPMDVSYYPHNYSHDRKFAPQLIGSDPAMIKIIYSRPSKNGRDVFGKLVPYGKVWRVGANEETEIKFYRDVMIDGKSIKAGTYALFAIPEEKEWTIILNSDLDQWGAYSYDEKKDILRFKATVSKPEAVIENFSIVMEKADSKNLKLFMGWDNVVVSVPISY